MCGRATNVPPMVAGLAETGSDCARRPATFTVEGINDKHSINQVAQGCNGRADDFYYWLSGSHSRNEGSWVVCKLDRPSHPSLLFTCRVRPWSLLTNGGAGCRMGD